MKIGLISLGCSKNLVDSENILGFLINKRGFEDVYKRQSKNTWKT